MTIRFAQLHGGPSLPRKTASGMASGFEAAAHQRTGGILASESADGLVGERRDTTHKLIKNEFTERRFICSLPPVAPKPAP
jgi:hypothetical protein